MGDEMLVGVERIAGILEDLGENEVGAGDRDDSGCIIR